MGAYANMVVADGPALYWKLDDASGDPQDSSGNARHAETAIGLAYRAVGVGAPIIDPDDDFSIEADAGDSIARSTLTGLTATDNFTVELWFRKPTDANGLLVVYGNPIFGSNGFYVIYDAASNQIICRVAAGTDVCRTDAGINTSQWYHVVVVRTGGTWKMYLDGVVQTALQGTTAMVTPDTEVAIFKAQGGSVFQGNGRAAHFAIYQTVLSASQIQEHAAGGPPPPVITTTSLPNGQIGTAYSQTVVATGGTLPLTWSIASGALPAGLSLGASTGTISGTPTTDSTSNFTVRATDADSRFDDQALQIIVVTPAVEISTNEHLADGFVGAAYSQTLQAVGGSGTFTWSLVSGTLPAGLSLSASGTIAGTPTTAGAHYFVVRATSNPSDDQGFYIFVADDPAVPLPAGEPVPTIQWRLVLCTSKGAYVSMLDGIAAGVELEYKMNRPAMLTFDVPSEDPRVNIVHTDEHPYLAIGVRSVKAYRKIGSGAGNWDLKFAGRVWSLEDQGDGTTVRTRVICFDNLKNLEKRVVRNKTGGYKTQVRWWNAELYPDVIQSRVFVHNQLFPGTGEDGTSGAHIIREMVRRTKKWGGSLGGGNPPAENAPVGIDEGGGWDFTAPMSVSFDQEYILPAITRICDTLTVDLVVLYLDVFNGAMVRLGGHARSGKVKTDTVIFAYAAAPHSAREYVRTQTLDQLANYVHLFGKTLNNKDSATAENAASQTTYGVMESIESVPDVEHKEFLQFLANMQVALRKDPRDLIAIVPTPEESPVPWNDYWIGDTVSVDASSSPYPVTRQTVDGVQRIYGITVTLDEDYGEYVSSLIVSPSDA